MVRPTCVSNTKYKMFSSRNLDPQAIWHPDLEPNPPYANFLGFERDSLCCKCNCCLYPTDSAPSSAEQWPVVWALKVTAKWSRSTMTAVDSITLRAPACTLLVIQKQIQNIYPRFKRKCAAFPWRALSAKSSFLQLCFLLVQFFPSFLIIL